MNNAMIPKYTVIQYVRDKNGSPRGVLVAVKNGDYVGVQGFKIGYSLCNKKDRFSKKMALDIAIGRAEESDNFDLRKPYPREVENMFVPFFERCKKYYKA